MLMAADNGKVTLLSLFDMSAAFDCINHPILLHHLQVVIGIGSTAVHWIWSFLRGCTQKVLYGSEPLVR
jgi:hypothetical protein